MHKRFYKALAFSFLEIIIGSFEFSGFAVDMCGSLGSSVGYFTVSRMYLHIVEHIAVKSGWNEERKLSTHTLTYNKNIVCFKELKSRKQADAKLIFLSWHVND